MKQVWILNHYAKPPGDAGGTRHFHLAEYLRPYGWNATIIAASVDHQTGHQRMNSKSVSETKQIGGVDFLWVNTPSYSGNGSGRVRNMLSYAWRVCKKKTTEMLPKPDVVIGSSVHPFAAVSGALLARRFEVPFIFEVRDLWPQTLIDMERLSETSPITWALRKLELWLYRQSVRIVVLLPYAYQYIEPLGIAREKVVWIPNGVDLSLFPGGSATAKKASKNKFTLMYFGAHGQANGLDNILRAMSIVQRNPNGEEVHLRLIGDGPLKQALEVQAQELQLRNVHFEDSVPKNQIPELAAQADAFVIAVLNLPKLYRFGISMNKLFDYLAAGRPIIIASNASNNPVADAEAGITVRPDQPQALAEAILDLASRSLSERQRMGENGRLYVEQNHGFDQLAAKLAGVLDEVC